MGKYPPLVAKPLAVRSVLNKTYRIWLCLLVVGAFFIFFGELAFDRTLNSALFRSLLQDKIGTAIGFNFDYRSMQVSLIPLGVQFYDIEAHRADGKKFSAKRATADLSWWSLFMGEPKVGNFRLEHPVAHLTWQVSAAAQQQNGANSRRRWPHLPGDQIERITIIDPDLHLDIIKHEHRHQLTLRGGQLVLDLRQPQSMSVSLHLAALNYHHNDKQRLQDLSLTAEGELGTDNFAFNISSLSSKNIEQLRGKLQGRASVDAERVLTSPLQVKGKFNLRGDLQLLDNLLNIARSQGRSSADFELEMQFTEHAPVTFKAAGYVRVEQAQLGGKKLHNSEAHLTVTPKQLSFRDGKLIIGNARRGNFRGKVVFAAPTAFDFHASIKKLTLAELLSSFNTNLKLFDFDIATEHLRVHGQGKPFALHVDSKTTISALQIHKLRNYQPSPSCAVQLALHSSRKRLNFKQLQGHCPATANDAITMNGSITYGSGQLDLRVAAPALDLTTLAFLLPEQVQGHATATATIKGAKEKIVVSSKLNLQKLQLETGKIDTVKAKLDFHRNFVNWHDVHLRFAHGGEIRSPQGKLTYADLLFNAQLNASRVRAADLRPLLHRRKTTLSFNLNTLSAQLSGFLPHPLAYRGKIQAKLAAIHNQQGEKLADTLSFAAKTDKRGWQLQLNNWQRAQLRLHGSISQRRRVAFRRKKFAASPHLLTRLGMSRADELQVQLTARQEDSAAQSLPYLGKHLQAVFRRFSLNLSGKIKRLHGEVLAELEQFKVAGLRFGKLHFKGAVENNKIALQLHDSPRSLQGQLQVDLATPKLPFTWQLAFKDFDMQHLVGVASDEHSYARLRGHWDLQGHLTQWFASSGELALDTFQLRHLSTETGERAFLLQLIEPLRIVFAQGKLTIADNKKITLHGSNTTLSAVLGGDCTLRRPTMDFDGSIDTAVLPHFLDEIDASTGFLQLAGKLRWSRDEPQFSVQLERLSPLAVSVAGLRPAFNDIDIKAHYRRGVLFIDSLQGRKGEGTVTVQGEINRSDETQSFLQIELQNAHFVHPVLGFKNTELHIDGDLRLQWRTLPLELSGTLTISKASNFSDFDIRKVILSSFGEKKYRTIGLTRKAIANFDLNIVADRSLTIENRNMLAQLSARLQLRGNNSAPQLTGFVKIDRGKFVYRRSFTLTHGMIRFEGGKRLNPQLDIKAYSEVPPYVVDLLIAGSAAQPVGELTVTPSLREDGTAISKADILMLLSRGTLPNPNEALSDTGSAGFSEVTNVLVGQFERPLEDLLKRSGQDVISRIFIDTYASQKGVLYPKLTAPINLPWRDWDLSLQVDPYTWKLLTEYPIHDSITLSGSISGRSQDDEKELETRDDANDQAVDLKFRFSIP